MSELKTYPVIFVRSIDCPLYAMIGLQNASIVPDAPFSLCQLSVFVQPKDLISSISMAS